MSEFNMLSGRQIGKATKIKEDFYEKLNKHKMLFILTPEQMQGLVAKISDQHKPTTHTRRFGDLEITIPIGRDWTFYEMPSKPAPDPRYTIHSWDHELTEDEKKLKERYEKLSQEQRGES